MKILENVQGVNKLSRQVELPYSLRVHIVLDVRKITKLRNRYLGHENL
jgi:hypothetical protein